MIKMLHNNYKFMLNLLMYIEITVAETLRINTWWFHVPTALAQMYRTLLLV